MIQYETIRIVSYGGIIELKRSPSKDGGWSATFEPKTEFPIKGFGGGIEDAAKIMISELKLIADAAQKALNEFLKINNLKLHE